MVGRSLPSCAALVWGLLVWVTIVLDLVADHHGWLEPSLGIIFYAKASVVSSACVSPDVSLGQLSLSGEASSTFGPFSTLGRTDRLSICVAPTRADIFIRFQLTSASRLTVETIATSGGSDVDTVMQVNNCSSLANIGCNDDYDADLFSLIQSDFTAGSYLITVSIFDNGTDSFRIKLTDVPATLIPTQQVTPVPTSISNGGGGSPTGTLRPTSSPRCVSQDLCQVQRCEANAESCNIYTANGVTLICSDCPPSQEALTTACPNVTATFKSCSDADAICPNSGYGPTTFYNFDENGGVYQCQDCKISGIIATLTDSELPKPNPGPFIGVWVAVMVAVALLSLLVSRVLHASLYEASRFFLAKRRELLVNVYRELRLGDYLLVQHPLATLGSSCCNRLSDKIDQSGIARARLLFELITSMALAVIFASINLSGKQSCYYLQQGGSTTIQQTTSSSIPGLSLSISGLLNFENLRDALSTSTLSLLMLQAVGLLILICKYGPRSDHLGSRSLSLLVCIVMMLCAGGLLAYAIQQMSSIQNSSIEAGQKLGLTFVIFIQSKLLDYVIFSFVFNTVVYEGGKVLVGRSVALEHAGDASKHTSPYVHGGLRTSGMVLAVPDAILSDSEIGRF